MAKHMDVSIRDNIITLSRDQWKGNEAYISNYPGLLDAVKKYTWTYIENKHPYLNCNKLGISLHKFVLQFLYGEDRLCAMLGETNIIEHLDNNGLNCAYENLHVLSDDLNKAKAFSIDKMNATLEKNQFECIPAFITDVYYSHENKYFQLQVFFNKNIVFNKATKKFVERFIFQYDCFENLYIDWLYCFECLKREEFDPNKHHANKVYEKDVTFIELKEDEKDSVVIQRDGIYYLVIRTNKENRPVSFMTHSSFTRFEELID